MRKQRSRILILAGLAWPLVGAAEPPVPTVLHVATERHTALALNHAWFAQFAALGFGTPQRPWHAWFGSKELRALVHLPGFDRSAALEIGPEQLLGSRFGGRSWRDGFDALRSLDSDGSGIVEREELDDLYVWVDFELDGTLAPRDDALLPAGKTYAGFDLRAPVRRERGWALEADQIPFAVLKRGGTRSHLLDLPIRGAFRTRDLAYLSYAATGEADASPDLAHPFGGRWRWRILDREARSRAGEPESVDGAGTLILAARGRDLRGVVRYEAPYGDHVNLPLRGTVDGDTAEWRSISPLGLTRSRVRYTTRFGRPVLHGRAWSNRDGRPRVWEWEATRDGNLE